MEGVQKNHFHSSFRAMSAFSIGTENLLTLLLCFILLVTSCSSMKDFKVDEDRVISPKDSKKVYDAEKVAYLVGDNNKHTQIKTNVCLSLSGGGLRASGTSLGFLQALNKRSVPPNSFRAISAVSGSTWTVSWLIIDSLRTGSSVEQTLENDASIHELASRVNLIADSVTGGVIQSIVYFPFYLGLRSGPVSPGMIYLSLGLSTPFLSKADTWRYVPSDLKLAELPEALNKVEMPPIVFGATAAILRDQPHRRSNQYVRDFRYSQSPYRRWRPLDQTFQSPREISLPDPTSEGFFEFGSEALGSPYHGYVRYGKASDDDNNVQWRSTGMTLASASVISSLGLNSSYRGGQTGVLDDAVSNFLGVATRYRIDDFEMNFPYSKYWDESDSKITASHENPDLVSDDVDIELSDGGFADNLAITPMLWRKCERILVLDASEDPNGVYDELMAFRNRLQRQQEFTATTKWVEPQDGKLGRLFISYAGNEGRTPSEVMIVKIRTPKCVDPIVLTGLEQRDFCQFLRTSNAREFPFDPIRELSFSQKRYLAYVDLGRYLFENSSEEILEFVGKS